MSLFSFTQPLAPASETGPREVVRGSETKVLFRAQGRFHVARERCVHRGMKLKHAEITADCKLKCPYHGILNMAESCSSQLQVAYGTVWNVQPGEKIPIEVPENFAFCGAKEILLPAPFHVVLDNFNEGSHTPYVHRLLGPLPAQSSSVQFDWKDGKDEVDIHYQGPQRRSLLFHGLRRHRSIDWDIQWKTRFSPVHMIYHSKWLDTEKKKQVSAQNINYYYIFPHGDQQTTMYAFVFTEVLPIYKWIWPIVKRISMALTLNQIREDEVFYPKIQDLPASLEGLRLNRFDEPLPRIRQLTEDLYLSKASPHSHHTKGFAKKD